MLNLNQLVLAAITLSHAIAYGMNNLLPSSTGVVDINPLVPTQPSATPSRKHGNFGIWTPASIQKIIKEWDKYSAHRSPGAVEQRDQYIFALCPESWAGGSPKACSDCGGDTITHGQCDQIMLTGSQEQCQFPGGCGVYCKCVSETKDTTGRITSVATVNGQAGTVIYEPITLLEYSGLQASTTVTITDLVATSTDSSADMETFVAVIVAGGVAWWVAEQLGASAAIAAIDPPSKVPDGGKEDNELCKKDPREDCADCGGGDNLNLCSSRPEIGCPCDEKQHCPNEPPKCTDPSCGGDNGRSQCSASGTTQGCTCCPDNVVSCSDTACSGDVMSKCQADMYHGCGCLWIDNNGADPYIENSSPDPITPDQLSSMAAAVFTIAWGAVISLVPGLSPPHSTVNCPYESYTPTVSLNTGSMAVTFLPVTNCYCNCGPTITPLYWGTNSAQTTSSWCMKGKTSPDGYQLVTEGCIPSADVPITSSPTTNSLPSLTKSEPTISPVKTPPPNAVCNKDSDCRQYTCADSSMAKCVAGAAGDPLTSLCQC